MTINWKDTNAKEQVEELLNRMTQGEDISIRITNIVSDEFCTLYGIDGYDECNGWQLDWWAKMDWKNTEINISGCTWYGTIDLFIDDEE